LGRKNAYQALEEELVEEGTQALPINELFSRRLFGGSIKYKYIISELKNGK